MKIKMPSFEKYAVWLIFLFYTSTNSFWAYRLFHDSNAFAAIACIIPILCFLVCFYSTHRKISLGLLMMVLSIYLVIIITSSLSIKMILFYGMCTIMMLDSRIAEKPSYLKCFYYFSLFFAVGSFINLFMPSLYRTIILPAFSGSSQYSRLVRWSNRATYFIIPGFANQTSFNVCHFVYGIGYILCGHYVYGAKAQRKWAIVVILFLCLILTNKRAHFIFLFFALAITYYCSSESKLKGKRFLILIVIGIAFLGIMLFLVPRLNIGVFNKFNRMLTALENDEDVLSGRLLLYDLAVKYFLQHPLLGIGWEGFRRITELGLEMQTHNIYLELLCETGIIGFSVFGCFFIYALWAALKNCKLARTDQSRFTASFCLFMQLFFLLYGLSGNPLYDPPYYIPYFLICTYTFSQRECLTKGDKCK